MDDELEVLDEIIFEQPTFRKPGKHPNSADIARENRKKSAPPPPVCVTDVDEVTSPGYTRRLIIERVVLYNFKSYGGTRIIGPYHKRFTSIIGPNGSGKSNVIDAMLFVFGFGARQMRFKNVAELIHNSAAYRNKNGGKPLDKMSVSIHFMEIIDKDPDKEEFEIVPGSELIITREAFQDSTSKYKINGSTSSKKQVVNALKDRHMDLENNRFLILQGEVEQISQMKPKGTKPDEEGLLEYLEDIIGTKQYLEPINEKTEEHSKLQDELQDKKSLYDVANKEIEDMISSKDKVDKYLETDKEMLKLEILVIHHTLVKMTEEKEAKTKELNKFEHDSKEHHKIIDDLTDHKKNLTAEMTKLENELESSENTFKDVKSKFQKLCARDEELRRHLNRDVTKIKEKTKTMENLKKKISDNEKTIVKNMEKIETMTKEIPSCEAALEQADKNLENIQNMLKDDIKTCTMALAEAEKSVAPLQSELDNIYKELSDLSTKRELMLQRTESTEKELKQIEESLSKVKCELADNNQKLKEAKVTLTQKKTTFHINKAKITELEEQLKEQRSAYKVLKIAYESQKLENEGMSNQNKQQSYINGLVNKGTLKGFFGKLCDLCTIDSKFEKALMVAGGAFMDHYVVETPEVASQIFDELRKMNLGRASVLALTVVEKSKGRFTAAMENGMEPIKGLTSTAKRLIDLIKPTEERFKICFFHAIGETIVTGNIEDAFTIGYNERKRVVTIEGELIEPDGRLCGGGSTSSKKTGSSAASKKEQINIKQVTDLETKLANLESEYTNVQKQIREYMMLEEEVDNKISMLKQLIDNDEASLAKYEKRKQSLLNQIKEISKCNSTAEIDSEIARVTKFKEAKEKDVKMLEKKVTSASNALKNVGGGKLKDAKAKYKSCEQNVTSKFEQIDSLKKSVTNSKADVERCKKQYEKLEKEILQHKENEEKINGEIDCIEKEAAKIKQFQDELANKIKINTESIAKHKAQIDEIEKQLSEFNLKLVEINHSLQDITKLLAQLDTNITNETGKGEKFAEKYKKSAELLLESIALTEEFRNIENEDVSVKIKKFDPAELVIEEIDIKKAQSQIEEKKKELEDMKVNLSVIGEFKNKLQELKKKFHELNRVKIHCKNVGDALETLCNKRKKEFLDGFAVIAAKLKEMYQAITFGGDAELELLDSTDPFTEGILFSVRPAKKSWKQIQNLSGGEKTLSSLALVFALHHYKPNPVYFMDEIDAALDFRNVGIIAQNIKNRTKNAQFIIISLRNQMFELCNRMIGIYKTFSVTKTVFIDPSKYDDIYDNVSGNEKKEVKK
ncbi:structural maintenance of chromosome 4 [Babesia microti strain RI]|uniref:Structural maintenance of chromosomes protein n=1 Tax=Babesia microti (strain RI) TaxID=1133968 RepID=A0A1N6LX03_BABMR|nr:structural maintenance of chromosome 4 [Babesia microti strain RI]SIO73410.1 structural maintenance of chromosome 4 [Babesia microti strain RI]|eukprot:XP_021337511.1 structural maintenance of chromosome 4 [Babesia microti strain RI]